MLRSYTIPCKPPLLHLEVSNDDLDTVKNLINQGIAFDLRDATFSTPMHFAALNGHVRILEYLRDLGADIDALNFFRATPLDLAALSGQIKAIKFLLKDNAHLYAFHRTMPINMKDWYIYMDIRDRFINDNSKFNLQYSFYNLTPLHLAVMTDDLKTLKLFKNNIIDHNALFYLAVWHGKLNLVKWFVAEGRDIKSKNSDGFAAIHLAAWGGYGDIVKYFVKQGVDVNLPSDNGETSIKLAINCGCNEVILVLCRLGAHINLEDQSICNYFLNKIEKILSSGSFIDQILGGLYIIQTFSNLTQDFTAAVSARLIF